MDLESVMDELYGLALGDFTTERNAKAKEAKAAGEKSLAATVGKLAKPSTAAWAVNMLVRHDGEDLGRVLDLGAELRAAQQNLDGAELRELNAQRQALIASIVERGRTVAADLGQPLSDAVADEVEQTLRAGMADPAAAEAVRSGQLASGIKPLASGGFDVSGAMPTDAPVVRRAAGRSPAKTQSSKSTSTKAESPTAETGPSAAEVKAAEKTAADAARVAGATKRAAEAARERLDELTVKRDDLTADRDELADRLRRLEAELAAAEAERAEASTALEDAASDAEQAAGAADRAQAALDALT